MDRVWMRAGDNADYESFDSMWDAGYDLGGLFGDMNYNMSYKKLPAIRVYHPGTGIDVGDSFTGYNYVSLFYGDDDAQLTKKFSKSDLTDFRAGMREAMDIPSRPTRKVRKPKSKRRKDYAYQPRLAGMRR